MWEWILRVWDNSGRHIKMNRFKLVDMDHLTEIPGLIV